MATTAPAKRCKVCELDLAERADVAACLPAALAAAATDDGNALRELAVRHAVTMTALRRHAEQGHAPAVPAPRPMKSAPTVVEPPVAEGSPATTTTNAELVETAAGDGWADATATLEPAKASPEGAQPWLRPRAARAEIEAQVMRLGELLRDAELTFSEKLKVEPLLRQALAQLALVSGESKPGDMDRLLLSPEFARVMGVIGDVLKRRCPEAFPEVIAAVKALDTAAPSAPADRAALAA